MNRPVKTKSGVILTIQELKRWEKHFSEIINKDDNRVGSKEEMRNVEEEEEDNSENENETEVNLDPPTKIEIQLALSQLKKGKAAGLDNILRISGSTKS